MANFNKVILAGNLTRDPELRYTPSEMAVCTLGLAVNRKYKDKDETCFVDITVWDKAGENCSKYLSKGKSVLVEGRLNYRTWETQEGLRRSKLDVVASGVTFLSPANGKDNGDNDGSENYREDYKQKHGTDLPPEGSEEIPF